MKKEVMKNLSIFVILMATVIFAACSSDENIIDEQPVTGTFTLSVNAIKGSDATRALTPSGDELNATWTAGDAVTVYNVTRNASLTGTLIAQGNGASTTLRGTLTGTVENGDVLKLKFLSPTYTTQDGTLAGIASSCDYAEATVTVSSVSGGSITTGIANFENQQAIVEFTLMNKATDAALNATKLTVTVGGTTINVTPASATHVLYVAIPGISSQTVYLSAKAGSTGYTYEKAGVTLTNSQYYGFTVSMDEAPDYTSTPLTFEAKEAGAEVTFTKGASVPNQIEYSTNGSTWTTYSETITLANVGDKVYFRGNNATYYDVSSASRISCSKGCYVYGNIMSLINPTSFSTATMLTGTYTFSWLFNSSNSYKIYSHPLKKLVLPATTLTANCYDNMFAGCSNLTIAPELPATTLAWNCYDSMFSNCTGLTTAPELPATTLANWCYNNMFKGCWYLTTAPELPATTLAEGCYQQMFYDCRRLTVAPELPATTLANSCYAYMFWACTGLTTAPELPATTLAWYCYDRMFCGCSSLTTAPELPATTLAHSCYSYMFQSCISLTTAPNLPATTLVSYCYQGMFKDCSSLNSVKCLATDISASVCTNDWLSGVAATGTFTKATGADWNGKTGANGIPSGWTVLNE